MTRGFIYEINTKSWPFDDGLQYMKESDLYEYCGQEFEYINAVAKEEGKEARNDLLQVLKNFGFTIQDTPDGTCIIASKESKKAYFSECFSQFKQKAADISLEDFASNCKPYDIQHLIDDRYSDAVYLDGGCFYTMDQFIRNMEEGKEYYLGNICLMH